MKRLTLITLVLGAALAIVPISSAMVLSDGSVSGSKSVPTGGISKAEYNALMIRSEALNRLYGNASTKLSPSEFANGGSSLSPQELAATLARGEALNSQYGVNSVTFRPDILGGDGNPSVTPVSGGGSFDWSTTIGSTLGAMLLLAAAATVVTRRRHRHELSF